MSETKGYVFNHTMMRIKDPKASLEFYTNILGMKLVRKLDFAEWKFSLFFLAYVPEGENVPSENEANAKYTFGRQAVLELTHNWGTEEQEKTPYHNGNTEPRGFGHICISVPNIQEACARFERMGVRFQKKLGEGGMKNIAFIKDPDDYWVEIVQPGLL
ncbi:lactoylglutathione lyase [Bdellovibrio bacteriovorus]|uniref:lactoylglutathione lyase n=1 Tax=Bdellovibrio bacteriovorus TaxID=959 RepID=A0A150WG86_BDEBC|nr:lactoylglutathione lyase [Bdellovibrio bacteriovorus]KYG61885.1 lactoylglutathione lyase [Bdellovibrio bacteriovorus]